MKKNEIDFIYSRGFFIYTLCGNIYEVPLSIFKTLITLIGGMGLKSKWPIIGAKIFDY